MNNLRIKVVGCGGIGSCLLNILPRYLSFLEGYRVDLTLLDGDEFEEHNRDRQAFQRNGNKAEVTAERIQKEFKKLFCFPLGYFLDEDNISLIIKEGDIIFSCVDNHATRRLISNHCEKLKNVVLISGGNEYTNGNIQVHVKRDGKDITLPIGNNFHPEIKNAQGKLPSQNKTARTGGCQNEQVREPQLLITNNFIAALMLNAFYGYLENVFDSENQQKYDEVYADVKLNATRPCKRS